MVAVRRHLLKFLAVAAALPYVAAGLTFAGRVWWKAGAAAGVAALLMWAWFSFYALGLVAAGMRFRYIVHSWEPWERYTKGLCVHCGYDLRAGHDKCPECGQPTPEKYCP
jgi:hypothetical protein